MKIILNVLILILTSNICTNSQAIESEKTLQDKELWEKRGFIESLRLYINQVKHTLENIKQTIPRGDSTDQSIELRRIRLLELSNYLQPKWIETSNLLNNWTRRLGENNLLIIIWAQLTIVSNNMINDPLFSYCLYRPLDPVTNPFKTVFPTLQYLDNASSSLVELENQLNGESKTFIKTDPATRLLAGEMLSWEELPKIDNQTK